MIANRKIGNAWTDLLDDTCTFVSEHHRHGTRSIAVDHRKIGVTQPCGTHPQQHFSWAGRREIDLSHLERCRLCVRRGGSNAGQDRSAGFHGHRR